MTGRRWILEGESWRRMKRLLADRDGGCVICRKEAADAHHVIFRSEHRDDRETNLVCLCRACHDAKAHGPWKKFWQGEFQKYLTENEHVVAWRKKHETELAALYEKAGK